MSIVDKKNKVFGKIAAARTLTGGLPKFKLTSSLNSINNGGNSVGFLTDLIKSLIGYEALVESVVEILTTSIPNIEQAVSKNIKSELKTIVSCGVDPHLPTWVQSNSGGITIEVKKIDFLDILRTDPNSVGGQLLYRDITTPYTDSTDFNTFLYGVIQNDGVTHTWNNIFDITFNSLGNSTTPNNTLTIKANQSYDSKTLTDLNNDYIDSIAPLFETENIINEVMDIIYGVVSSNIGKSIKQLEMESKINTVIDKMVNNTNINAIEDSAFSFTNPETMTNQIEAIKRKSGFSSVDTSIPIPSTIPISSLTTLKQDLFNVNTLLEKKDAIKNNLNSMANFSSSEVFNKTDVVSVKLNFIQGIINNLVKGIINMILSPKVIMAFVINYKIVYGLGVNSDFSDPIDFIKKNKKLTNEIMKGISEEIIKILLSIAIKEINALVSAAAIKKQKEKSLLKLAQLQSLIGVPQSQIKKFLENL
jgi:hypothetical protein